MSLVVDITKKYKDFTLHIKFETDGLRLGILGASGCGKSMTLKSIAGIEQPDQGFIQLNGRVLFDSEKKINIPPQKRKVGYLFQNYALFPNMTVRENIGIGIRKNQNKNTVVDNIMRLLQIKDLEKRYPNQISGGQQQRVALARVLAYEPEVLMLDEPFAALDSYLKDQLKQELLEVIKEYKGDVIMVSHSRDELYQFCDTMAVLDQGKLIEQGKTIDLFHMPENIITARLTGCKNISKAFKISDYEIIAVDWNIQLKTKHKIADDITYVGIRSHDIRLGDYKEKGNSCEVDLISISEEPFYYNLVFQSSKSLDNNHWIYCKITKEDWKHNLYNTIPNKIHFPEEHIMLLKE